MFMFKTARFWALTLLLGGWSAVLAQEPEPTSAPEGALPGVIVGTTPNTSPPIKGELVPECHRGCDCGCVPEFDFKKVPRVRPIPKLGFAPVLPTGPGFYSELDQLRGVYLQAAPKHQYPRHG